MRDLVPHAVLSAFLVLTTSPPSVVHATSPAADDVQLFHVLGWERDHHQPAARRLVNLNVDEPRTVRVIYFLPSDRVPRQGIDASLDTLIGDVQRFYADEMERHGFGRKTFRLETDGSGRTLVHRVNGRFTASYYNEAYGAFDRVWPEVDERFDLSQNLHFIAAEITYPGSYWRSGGQAYLGGTAIVYIPFADHGDKPFLVARYFAGHELGHSFGLQHDLRSRTDRSEGGIMSYRVGVDFNKRRLSKCAAGWLSVHPYLNSEKTSPSDKPATIRLLPPLAVPPNAVSLRFEMSDADGLHQAQLMISGESGFGLHSCKSLNGSNSTIVQFITTELTARDSNRVSVGIIDLQGNFRWKPYPIYVDDTLERVDGVIDVEDLAPEKLRVVSGHDQIGFLNARLTEPFVVTVRDADEEPVAGIQVTFQVTAGDGSLSVKDPWTDADGRAGSFLNFGNLGGECLVAASVAGVADQVTFVATVDTTVVADMPVRTLTGHTDRVLSVAYSPDGGILATGSADRTVRLWDVVKGEQIAEVTGFTHRPSAVYSPDGRTLATSGNWGEVRILDGVTGEHKQTLVGHTSRVSALAYSPGGRTLATGDIIGEIRLWDAVTGQHEATLRGPAENVLDLAFKADGGTLASSMTDGTVRIWDTAAEQLSIALTVFREQDRRRVGYGGVGVAFSPDGRTLATTGAGDLKIRLWDAITWEPLRSLTGHRSGTSPVAFSPDGAILATGAVDSEIRLWDAVTGYPLRVLIGHTRELSSVAFSADGNTLASGSADHTIRLWDVSHRPSVLEAISAERRQGPAGAPLARPLVVLVVDQYGDPFPGASVTFAVTTGGGTLSATSATTDAKGRAVTTLTLGPEPGTNTIEATVGGLDPVTFTAIGLAVPHTLTVLSSGEHRGPAGTALTEPFVVEVQGRSGQPLEGVQVTFTVTAGDGALSVIRATTDLNGRAASTLTLGPTPGTNAVEATVAGLEPVTFTATAEATPDFDGDGEVGFRDFFLFAEAFGGSDPRFDLDGSGTVDFGDFFLFAEHFGQPARAKLVAMAREQIGLPEGPQLQPNAPNPFNSGTFISWFQLQPGVVRVEVFALTGQRVAVLHEGAKEIGFHRLQWDGWSDQGHPLASGVYVYRLVTAEGAWTRKLTILR